MSSKFDLDLAYGKVYEKKLYDILQNKKVEVKTERDIWVKTGNIAIEIRGRDGRLSGISITEKLKNVARDHFKNSIMGGDDNQSKMILVPISEIMNGDKK